MRKAGSVLTSYSSLGGSNKLLPKVSTAKSAGCSPAKAGSIIAVDEAKVKSEEGEDEVAMM